MGEVLLQSTLASRRFTIKGLFAEGAQSRLYTAHDEITGQTCLLKTGEGVKQEALHSLEFNHPYIAHAYDFGTHPQIGTYAAYPKFSEPSLRQWRPPKLPELRRVVLQIAEVLAFLHHRGWLYHDFKPEHFLIGEDSIKVLDLGLCTKINKPESSNTFSGTFPYISPERLTGRAFDGRSDIFAFGMMLLHLFYPDESWSSEPSLAVLQQLLKKSHDLPQGFWKNLIVQMTSLEPSQRPESAAAVWKKLLPQNARGTFLIFPPPAMFSLAQKVLEAKERIVVAQSSSQINLDNLVEQVLTSAWDSGIPTIIFDLRRTSVEEAFCYLASSYSANTPKNLFTAIDILQKTQLPEVVIVFQGTTTDSKSFLAYALSAMSGIQPRILTTVSKELSTLNDVECTRINIPQMVKGSIEKLLDTVIPSKELAYTELFSNLAIFKIEQLISELSTHLPSNAFTFWPAITKKGFLRPAMKKFKEPEMRMLGYVGLAQGSLRKETMNKLIAQEPQLCRSLELLIARGSIELNQGRYWLNLPLGQALKQLGKSRRKLANELLNTWSINEEPEVLYNLSRIAGKRRLARYIALKEARHCSLNQFRDESHEWFYKAFEGGTTLPKSTLRRLVVRYMHTAQMGKAKRLLMHMRHRFKLSYQLADMFLDFDFRHKNLSQAQRRAERIVAIARKKRHVNSHDYFSTKLARFLILRKSFRRGEIILKKLLLKKNLRKRTLLLVHYCIGLSLLLRGNLPKAMNEFRKAIRGPHNCRSYTYMNLGVSLAQVGKFRQAMIFCSKSLKIFFKVGDLDKISYGLNNLGCVYQNAGDFIEAHKYYLRSAQLCRATRNKFMYVSTLCNLADVYRTEGRTDLALRFNLRAARLSKLFNLPVPAAVGLQNGGLQYAIQGKFGRAIVCIKRSLAIRKSLSLRREIAYSQEYLGITYLLAERYSKAFKYLNAAVRGFRASGCLLDSERAKLFGFLAQNQNHKSRISIPSSRQSFALAKGSFEVGLYNYVLAYATLNSSKFNPRSCRKDLVKAEYIFRKIPDLFWLAKLYKLKTEYFLKTGHHEKAALSLEAANDIFSRLGAKNELMGDSAYRAFTNNPPDFIGMLEDQFGYMLLMNIYEIVNELNSVEMIGKILSTSKKFRGTERVLLVLIEEKSYKSRIFTKDVFSKEEITGLFEIVKQKSKTCTVVLAPTGKSGFREIKVFACLALTTSGKTIGTVILENPNIGQLIDSQEVKNFSGIIGTALNNVLKLESINEENNLRRFQFTRASVQTGNSTVTQYRKERNRKTLKINKLELLENLSERRGDTGSFAKQSQIPQTRNRIS